jgi:gliding motility-associated-like protein
MEKRNCLMGFGVKEGWMVALLIILLLPIHSSYGQSGSCDPTTPFFVVDLSASPGGTWTSPNVSRIGNCCGTTFPDRCIEFEIHLNPGTVAINFTIASGAIPPGSMFYQIDCGPQIPVGQPVCITGPGPHTLTFCKPGNNPNTYAIEAIPSPKVSPPILASQTCPGQLWVQGLDPATIQWHEITSGTGVYDAFLSCTNCANPVVTPSANPPAYVDYVVCGTVQAPACTGIIHFCDTVRVTMFSPIQASVNPNPVSFCQDNTPPDVFASAMGGWGNLTYSWYNSSGQQVGSGQQWTPSTAGNYYVVVTDQLYPNCPADTVPFTVVPYPQPTIQITPTSPGICEGSSVTLTAQGANSYQWSPLTGLSQINNNQVIASPSATTTYTVTGTDAHGCSNTASVTVQVFPAPVVDAGPDQTICEGQSAQLQGSGAWLYNWTPAATLDNPSIPNPVATPTTTTTYYLTGFSLGPNIVFNGDFELGNVGFFTDYLYNPNLIPEGNYYITNNPRNTHPNFAQCEDHTPNPGDKMMVINGAPVPNQRVWCQNVSVTPNTDYVFSTWITSVHPLNPAVLQFSINGVLLGNPFTATSTVCNWQQFYQIWNSGANTSAEICIVNQNIIQNGNDFALDDISFAPLCSNIDSVTVYVNPVPHITISNDTICEGEAAQLQANSTIPNTSFTWNTGFSGNPLTVTPTSTTTYSVTGTSNGCSNSATASVVVNPVPSLNITATKTIICQGETTELTASASVAGSTFLWSTGDNPPSITVSPNTTTSYSVTVTSPDQCSNSAQITIMVNPIPSLSLSASDQEICQGENITIQAISNDPNATYLWSNGANTNVIIDQPNVTTNYMVTVTSSGNCTNSAQIQVTVNQNPSVVIIPSSSSICINQTATLQIQTNMPVATILWSTGETNVPTIQVSPNSSSTYSVTVSTTEQCSGSTQVTIQVNPLPNIQIQTQNEEICEGTSTNLVVTSNHPNTSFVWNTGTQGNSISVSPSQTSWYYVTATDQNGCQAVDSLAIVVHPNPKISISPSSEEICNGFSVTLTASSNHPNTAFLWNTGAQTATIVVTPSSSTTYMVTGTDQHGCTGSNRATIEVHPLPQIQLSSPSYALCPGDTAKLQAAANEPATYLWSTGETTPTITVVPPTTSSYEVTVTNSNGCSTIASIEVVVRPTPQITVYPSNPRICKGEEITLVATGANLYSWSPANGLNTTYGSVVIASPSLTTTYVVEGIDLYGCKATKDVTVDVRPIPNINFTSDMNQICSATTVRFTATSDQPIQSWTWNFGDPESGNANYGYSQNITHTFFNTGSYTISLEVVSVDGCKNALSKPDFVVVHPNPIAAFYRTPDITTVDNATIKFFDQSLGHQKVLWNFDDPSSGNDNISLEHNPTHTYAMEGEYWPTLYVENEWGCVDSVSNRVIVKNISEEYIPSAFSPNNDGVNDIFRPTGFNIDWTEYTMYIFDRWGNQIFETHSIEKGWDGRVNGEGEIVQQDVYVYKIILKDVHGVVHEFIGHVTLIK